MLRSGPDASESLEGQILCAQRLLRRLCAHKGWSVVQMLPDLEQEVALRVWQRYPKPTSLQLVARTVWLDYLRNEVYAGRKGEQLRTPWHDVPISDVTFGESSTVELECEVRDALEQIPREQADVLEGIYLHDRTMQEIANDAGVTHQRIHQRKLKAINSFARVWSREPVYK